MKIRHIEIRNFRGIKSLAWPVKGDLNCIIGPGDTCKTTILTALDFALSPRSALTFDDSDFYNQDFSQPILIQVTLTGWDETQANIRGVFSESKFARFKCGLDDTGPLPEPLENGQVAVSVSLSVDQSLEPKWSVVKGRDEGQEQDRKPIYGNERAVLGMSRVDLYSDFHFTWGHNTILTRLGADHEGNPNAVLSELAREMRQSDISGHESIAACQSVAETVQTESRNAGINLNPLSPKIDLQRRSVTAGALSLHEANVPLRNKGSGSKKLIAVAMQMKLHDGKNISLIDEIEMGLEPHRIRGLLYKLKASRQQIFTTTHSPVVIRELDVDENELYVCRCDAQGNVSLDSLAIVPGIQGPVRSNPQAFLGSKIIACEGRTEIGCLRAYDIYRFDASNAPVWSLATSYYDCHTASKLKPVCSKLVRLAYRTAAFCDNDAPEHISAQDVADLRSSSVHVCKWDDGHSTENQLFHDMPWSHISSLLAAISDAHDSLDLATMVDAIVKHDDVAALKLTTDPDTWPESTALRKVIGDLANKQSWIKRIDYAESTFAFALPLLPENSITKLRLNTLWTWIQNE